MVSTVTTPSAFTLSSWVACSLTGLVGPQLSSVSSHGLLKIGEHLACASPCPTSALKAQGCWYQRDSKQEARPRRPSLLEPWDVFLVGITLCLSLTVCFGLPIPCNPRIFCAPIKNHKNPAPGDCKNVSAVRSTSCSWRGPDFGSQYPYCAQPPAIPAPEDSTPSAGLLRRPRAKAHTHIYTRTHTYTHKSLKLKYSFNSKSSCSLFCCCCVCVHGIYVVHVGKWV